MNFPSRQLNDFLKSPRVEYPEKKMVIPHRNAYQRASYAFIAYIYLLGKYARIIGKFINVSNQRSMMIK